jgi:hypothetical protein
MEFSRRKFLKIGGGWWRNCSQQRSRPNKVFCLNVQLQTLNWIPQTPLHYWRFVVDIRNVSAAAYVRGCRRKTMSPEPDNNRTG